MVVDANNLISRAIFASALGDLQAGGRFTGGIYGALGSLRSILSDPLMVGVGPIYACFDNGVPVSRMRALPDYKKVRRASRESLPEAEREKALGQILACYEMWPKLGVCCLSYKNREADDVVAAVVRVLLASGVHPTVVSSDRDLFQLVATGADVFDLRSRTLITLDEFAAHSDGVPLGRWLLYRALVGDSSDGIKGAPGCGPKRAKQLMLDLDDSSLADPLDPHAQLRHLCAVLRDRAKDAKKPRAFETSVLSHEDHLHRVLRAIDLRASFGPTDKLAERLTSLPRVDTKSFLQQCRALQFSSILGDPLGMLNPFLAAEARR
ncbi:MAG: hypothetical protein FJX72_07820 [Armatimonadetes bacterium]|nr:hypothetical protein [Armatimonadota bacterium]